MRLVQVTEDTTLLGSGYERNTWQCSACSIIERRMTFTRQKTLIQASVQPGQTGPVQIVLLEPSRTAPLEQPLETTEAVSLEQIQTERVDTTASGGPARTRPGPPESSATVL